MKAGSFLLNMLITSGTLPNFDVDESFFQYWVSEWLGGINNPENRLIMRRYARWGLSTKPWAGLSSRPTNYTARFQRLRSQLRDSEAFLTFADSLGHTPLTLPQRFLDAFIAESTSRRDNLAQFTRWLKKNGFGHAVASHRSRQMPASVMSPDGRWRLARRLLHGPAVDPVDRVGGLLILLYGQTATRIVSLHRSAVTFEKNEVLLTIADHPIRLPDELGEATTVLFNRSTTAHTDQSDTWLFRGRVPGKHLTSGALARRVTRIGVPVRDSRSAALLDLASDMPVALLADLLGLSIAAASRWSKVAKRDWLSYPSLRMGPYTGG
ncbi:hypothetical protein QK290_07290 [Pseudarthrobacter sp. AL07]|uniref:hypothetical protein n=1 Tax=unclassified Pseudarthrobacter TaxID=2647000 RepID=UPI00249A947E|nr:MULTISPECIES: hypothetical protein [unclassified Pseudarthrobacter]MDI3194256.1 hypothetical protein [Pseudarthrobacter sp. AL20]MDI3208323.1 hypothetical protein [Pseudarthrobacter sp. AL07]